jgi:hypothetical protein
MNVHELVCDNDKGKIIRMILDGYFNTLEVMNIIKSGELNFTADDIKQIFEDYILDFSNICELILDNFLKYNDNNKIINIMSCKRLSSYQRMYIIQCDKLNFTVDDIIQMFYDNLLSVSDIYKLIINDILKYNEDSKNKIMKMILDNCFSKVQIVRIIESGKLNLTFDDIIEIYGVGALLSSDIYDLIVNTNNILQYNEDSKNKIMKMILDKRFISLEIMNIIKSGKFNFTVDDIMEIYDTGALLGSDLYDLIVNNILKYNKDNKHKIMKIILDGSFVSYKIDSASYKMMNTINILNIFDLDDIEKIVKKHLLSYSDINTLILKNIGKYSKDSKNKIMLMILDRFFDSSTIITIIKCNILDFDDIKQIIDNDLLIVSDIYKLILDYPFRFTADNIISIIEYFSQDQIKKLIESGEFDFTLDNINKIIDDHCKLSYNDMCELILHYRLKYNKDSKNKIMNIILSRRFASSEVVRIIQCDIFNFTFDDINQMIDNRVFDVNDIDNVRKICLNWIARIDCGFCSPSYNCDNNGNNGGAPFVLCES